MELPEIVEAPKSVLYIHGLGGSPSGTVSLLKTALTPVLGDKYYHGILASLAHQDQNCNPLEVMEQLDSTYILKGSILIGVSLGGLLAAAYSQWHPSLELITFPISAPTWYKNLKMTKGNLISRCYPFYSSTQDTILKGRTDWEQYVTCPYDIPWLTHATDNFIPSIVHWISSTLTSQPLIEDLINKRGALID